MTPSFDHFVNPQAKHWGLFDGVYLVHAGLRYVLTDTAVVWWMRPIYGVIWTYSYGGICAYQCRWGT